MTQKFLEAFVTGLYVGKIKKLPGTCGTILAIPLAIGLNQGGVYFYMASTFLLIVASILACHIYELRTKLHDQSSIVIDEVVGYLVAATWLPAHWLSYFFSFVLFRFFDILKPFPINIIDQKVKGGLGVVADDLFAGLLSNIILQILFSQPQIHGWLL